MTTRIGMVLRTIENTSSIYAYSHPANDAISFAASGRIDSTHRDHSDRGQAGQKEIVAAAGGDEFGQMAGDERGGVGGAARDDVLGRLSAAADQRTGIVASLEVEAVIHPLLLDEFELPEQAGADRHEDHAFFAIGINVRNPRRRMRRRLVSVEAPSVLLSRGSSMSRGLARRIWAPKGHFDPSRSSP